MKRDKTISVKVNSDLLEKFNKIVDSKTRRWEYAGRVHYDYLGQLSSGKFSVGDLLEKALKEYVCSNLI